MAKELLEEYLESKQGNRLEEDFDEDCQILIEWLCVVNVLNVKAFYVLVSNCEYQRSLLVRKKKA